MAENNFPFGLDNVVAWIVRRKDGVIVRFNYIDPKALPSPKKEQTTHFPIYSGKSSGSGYHYSEWCDHAPLPSNPPLFQHNGIALYVADASGARKNADLFDVAIDGGSVLNVSGEYDLPTLYGDPGLKKKLERYVEHSTYKAPGTTKILKIRWADRGRPPVRPEFWPALLKLLEGERDAKIKTTGDPDAVLKVVTICQGGHGRSGSAMVCLMMWMTDYTPLDALTHIMAMHCARAIESKDQHVYLNSLATLLGREPDALDAEEVKSFKDRFLSLDSEWAQPYKDQVRGGQGAGDRKRDSAYM